MSVSVVNRSDDIQDDPGDPCKRRPAGWWAARAAEACLLAAAVALAAAGLTIGHRDRQQAVTRVLLADWETSKLNSRWCAQWHPDPTPDDVRYLAREVERRDRIASEQSAIVAELPVLAWRQRRLLDVAGGLVGAAAALYVVRWVAGRRARRLSIDGHCVACGYDLRGSIGRCPECGLVPI